MLSFLGSSPPLRVLDQSPRHVLNAELLGVPDGCLGPHCSTAAQSFLGIRFCGIIVLALQAEALSFFDSHPAFLQAQTLSFFAAASSAGAALDAAALDAP